jgi:hypothetical protein
LSFPRRRESINNEIIIPTNQHPLFAPLKGGIIRTLFRYFDETGSASAKATARQAKKYYYSFYYNKFKDDK